MADKALYVLAGYDDNTEERLAGMQNELYKKGYDGIQTKGIPMHFTLGSYDSDREEELVKRLKKIAETHKAFDVSFNHIGMFNLPDNQVLFVKPEVSSEMLLLKDEFRDDNSMFNWSSHTTLLIDKPEIIHKAIPEVLNNFSAFEGKVTTLHLYEFWPTRHIISVKLS